MRERRRGRDCGVSFSMYIATSVYGEERNCCRLCNGVLRTMGSEAIISRLIRRRHVSLLCEKTTDTSALKNIINSSRARIPASWKKMHVDHRLQIPVQYGYC